MKILVATDFSTRSNRALRQAGLLAQQTQAELHILHVVDDDQPAGMIRSEKREAERILNEQIASVADIKDVPSHVLVLEGDPFDGILRTANEIRPDLIVMGSHRKQMLDMFMGTTLERVIRKGPFPVLMVNHEAQRSYRRVVAPVDMTDTSADALRTALALRLIGESGATLLHGFFAAAKGQMIVAGLAMSAINEHVASERQTRMTELTKFLVEKDLVGPWQFRIEEGGPMEVIARAVEQLQPDLLVMGTHGRKGLAKALIGSVTEETLRTLSVDILVVPPLSR